MKKVLITGHKGFIGSNLHRYYEGKADLTLIDIAEDHYLKRIDARDFFRSDNTQYDIVWHMAGVIGGRKGIEGQPLSVAVDLSIDA